MLSRVFRSGCTSLARNLISKSIQETTLFKVPFHSSLWNQKGQEDLAFLEEMEQEFVYKPPGTWDREVPPLEPRPFLTTSKRTGAIAIKVGMTQDWDSYGAFLPLTVLWIDNCQVTKVKRKEKDGVTALQVGCGFVKEKNANIHLKRECELAGVPLKRKRAEFRVTEDALLPLGTEIKASHFVAGQHVDITGTTLGKGTQGVMKKWGFGGGSASHGNSKTHRSAGSIGACQDPGKVWKGKKMAGRMGNQRRTVLSCWIYKVDPEKNLLYVRGQVPGYKGNFILIKDAARKHEKDMPFPTHIGPIMQGTTTATPEKNPYHLYEEATKT